MSRNRLIAAGLLALAGACYFVIQYARWSGAAGAGRAHQRFLSYVEDKRWSKSHAMVSADYSDRWGFDRDDISLALQDLGSAFTFWLEIRWTPVAPPGTGAEDGAIALAGTVRVEGQGGPLGNIVSPHINGYASEPFTFRWRREGLLPWGWRLLSISHPSATVPAGYTPGDLGYRF